MLPFGFYVDILVLYMSFDKFLLAVELCDLSQADKSIIRVLLCHFTKFQFLNNKIYSYTKNTYLALANLILSFKNLQD